MEDAALVQSAAGQIIDWCAAVRRPLPWRLSPTPYHVWISEIMLQQTRIEAVIPYYERFLSALPDIAALAEVDDDKLMKLWEGLGYYSRARNLKKAAQQIIERFGGQLPGTAEELRTLSGIGEVLKAHNPDMVIWAVEPAHAAILSGGSIGTHIQMGIGDGVIPKVLNTEIYDDICIISDEEALQTSRDLAAKEGIMCGISSGTNVCAAIKLARTLGPGKTVVTILPDTAERYFSTPLFDD